jgi:arginine decarboxylase
VTTIGTRYPTLGFITGGAGQSNDGIPPQAYETFAYDSALLEARIENFNVVPYTSVLPPELYGNIVPVDKVVEHFHHGAVLEVIMSGHGAEITEYKAIATGIGITWAQDKNSKFVGGFAAEFVQLYTAPIDDDIAAAEARMWLTKSLKHELRIRDLKGKGEFEFHYNHLNLEMHFGYCLTCIGFLDFEFAEPVRRRE